MCGIAGIYAHARTRRVEPSLLERMRDTMHHRGPDGGGAWYSADAHVGLAHRRLSIIDLSASADQPMSNADGSIWVTYNGEIYNHVELRRELQGLGSRVPHRSLGYRSPGAWLCGVGHRWPRAAHRGRLRVRGVGRAFARALHSGARSHRREAAVLSRCRMASCCSPRRSRRCSSIPRVTRDIDPVAMYHYLSVSWRRRRRSPCSGASSSCRRGTTPRSVRTVGLRAVRYWDASAGAQRAAGATRGAGRAQRAGSGRIADHRRARPPEELRSTSA
jgi:hypothetical protein